jgi:DNA replicative helicase MCM subunit Mcm2 (Cdc46/Mcm family)
LDSDDLGTKARVATDLFEKGAARVRITGTDIEVDWREYEAATRPVSQNAQVNVSTSASSVASISNSIRQIVSELDRLGIDSAKAPEAKEKLKTLEEELRRKNPHWNVVKQVLHWALDFSRGLFLRLAVLIIDRYSMSKL